MSNNADKQAIEFFIKRAEYSAGLAERHCKDGDFSKGTELYKQAFVFYRKAEQNLPEDMQIKEKLNDIKIKYQDAKKASDSMVA